MSNELYSVEQVAERLGLHVRTVRNYVRDGRLRAVRIGKQYRISRADLEALTGGDVPPAPRESTPRHRQIAASSVVEIDAIGAAEAERLTTQLIGAANGRRNPEGRLRVQTIYDAERAQMKVVVLASSADTAIVLNLIEAMTASQP